MRPKRNFTPLTSLFIDSTPKEAKNACRHASRRSSAARSCNLSSPSLFTTLLAGGVALQKHKLSATHIHHTPNAAPSTPRTLHFMAQPHICPQWPPSPALSPLTCEEGTLVIAVLCSSSTQDKGVGVGDGAAHLRIHDFNEHLNMMVALLVPNKEDHRQGGAGGSCLLSLLLPVWSRQS